MRKMKIPLLGLVENMSGFVCPDNGVRYDIFGKGGARKYADNQNIDFLGEVPIFMQLREFGDQGRTMEVLDNTQIKPVLDEVICNLCLSIAEKSKSGTLQDQLPVL